ncbi:AbrB/MazE/SpoVT family DNA-binding domain-containing protein [Falsiroseomonas sp. HW251]|uniref:AbrB/MazE/SpoVT family DNA-binding domain-containing protein n=1 Tax=Falsiroseomonas sp. HW251 TaxID=3390998 RepID=UPI003D31746E
MSAPSATEALIVRVDQSGRVVIPRALREALGIPEGGVLTLSVVDGELRGMSRLVALHRIQDELARLPPREGSPASAVEELFALRRAEALRELQDDPGP